jgi:DNA-binding MurR/RpiR family transcriptional regulator
MTQLADRLQEAMTTLTPSERKVARRIISAEPTIVLEPTATLAAMSGVSAPTVTRFTRKLGYEDYAEFQRSVRAEIREQMVSPVETLQTGGRAEAAGLERHGALVAESVRRSFASLAAHEFQSACRLLATTKRPVATFGGWTTHVLARHLARQLQHIRPGVQYVGESAADTTAWEADANSQQAAVLFDLRRYEKRTIEIAEGLRRHTVRFILITDTWMSPCAPLATYVLPVTVDSGHKFDSLVPAMAVVEALVDQTARLLGDAAMSRVEAYNAISMAAAQRWEASEPGSTGYGVRRPRLPSDAHE